MQHLLRQAPMPCKKFRVCLYQTTTSWIFFYLDAVTERDSRTLAFCTSNAVFSFDPFVEWLKAVETGQGKTDFYIEEEGPEKGLVILPVKNPAAGNIRFLLTNGYEPTVAYMDLELQRQEFVDGFRRGLRIFFNKSFQPKYWDLCGPDYRSGRALLRRMRTDAWLQIKHPDDPW